MTVAWVKLELDLATFDPKPWDSLLERIATAGITMSTLADLGATEDNLAKMYELNAECSADIPGRGPFHTWDEYRRVRIDIDSFDPRGVVIAHRGSDQSSEWIGMSGTSTHPSAGYLFKEMTGVRRTERRRGLATAMKVRNAEFGDLVGLSNLRTVHHPGNVAMIELNRRLGYVDATWPYPAVSADSSSDVDECEERVDHRHSHNQLRSRPSTSPGQE
jgi:hypothetical protein